MRNLILFTIKFTICARGVGGVLLRTHYSLILFSLLNECVYRLLLIVSLLVTTIGKSRIALAYEARISTVL